MSPHPVTVLTARRLGKGGSSVWAQGGIAAAVAADDSPQLHLADTCAAGAGLVEHEPARLLCEEGPARIDDLLRYGVQFDQTADGSLKVGREAAHQRNRVVHAGGDQAGAAIMNALAQAASRAPHITILERMVVEDLLTDENGHVAGALVYDVAQEKRVNMSANATVLATGGLGGLYSVTTNPVRAQGHGLAFAARAGAVIRDPEFVQFHPTALDVGQDPAPLATEALRGEGAYLVNGDGRRFMDDYHPDMELAPRDVVARAVEAERNAGRGAFLDARDAIGDRFEKKFPTVFAAAKEAGFDPSNTPFPIAPACHYHMGGVLTDTNGRTTLPGLYAAGEVASTGVHGANRLASNSLLETVVFGARIAQDLHQHPPPPHGPGTAPRDRLDLPPRPADGAAIHDLRVSMSRAAALLRSEESLETAAHLIDSTLNNADTSGLFSAAVTAKLLVSAAQHRQESRGAHMRTDFPVKSETPYHSDCRWENGGVHVTHTQMSES